MLDIKNERADGVIVSSVEPQFMAWHGKYETAAIYRDGSENYVKILAGYNTLEECLEGHERILNMSEEEFYKLPDLDRIGGGELW